MKTVVVSGGAGFIGSHLCERLLRDNYRVVCIDNFSTGSKHNIVHLEKNPLFSSVVYDVSHDFPDGLIKSADYIYHLASPASPNHHSPISYHSLPFETMLVNTRGTLNFLRIAEKLKSRFLFSSTSEVYGNPEVHPQPETYNGSVSTTGPRSVYDEAKRFGETLTAYFGRERKVDVRIARIFNTYGPRMRHDDKRMLVNFILQGLSGESITLYGDGSQTRSLIYIDDMIEGLMGLMFTNGLSGEIVNLGSPEEHTVRQFAQLVKKFTRSTSAIIESETLPQDDPVRRRADISKAKKLLHWEPTVSLEKGVQKTIDYFRS